MAGTPTRLKTRSRSGSERRLRKRVPATRIIKTASTMYRGVMCGLAIGRFTLHHFNTRSRPTHAFAHFQPSIGPCGDPGATRRGGWPHALSRAGAVGAPVAQLDGAIF
jgi:hypothetical protein